MPIRRSPTRAGIAAALLSSLALGSLALSAPVMAQGASNTTIQQLQVLAQELNKQLPMEMDGATTMTGVRADGATLIYNYVIDMNPDLAKKQNFDMAAVLKPMIASQICGDAASMVMLNEGVDFTFLYDLVDGTRIMEMDFGKADCP